MHMPTEPDLLRKTLDYTGASGVSGSSEYRAASVLVVSMVRIRRSGCMCPIEVVRIMKGRCSVHGQRTLLREDGAAALLVALLKARGRLLKSEDAKWSSLAAPVPLRCCIQSHLPTTFG
jgi:hypothetical protein